MLSLQALLLFNDKYSLQFSIRGINDVIDNLKPKYKLAKVDFESENIKLEGLLGVDCIQHFRDFQVVRCMNGSAFKICNKIVPFGNVDLFLSEDQLARKLATPTYSNSKLLCQNFISSSVDPISDQFDPISGILSENNLNLYMNNLVSLESIGIKDGPALSDSDHIEKFQSNILLSDN